MEIKTEGCLSSTRSGLNNDIMPFDAWQNSALLNS